MSYGIIRVQKMTKGSVMGMQIHNQREKDHSHTNADIDFLKSNQNYDLKNNHEINYQQKIKEVISKNYTGTRAIRKDAVLMCECLITSDNEFFKTLSPKQQEQFFRQSYDWLCERFGERNVIAATVHLDERTPHMHFDFVPMTAEGRLSAKEIFRYKTDLSKLHDDFYKHIGQNYGLERGEHKEGQQHLSVIEYKEQTSKEVKRLESRKKELQEKQPTLERLENDISCLEKRKKMLEEEVSIAESHCNAVQATLEDNLVELPAKAKKTITGHFSLSESEYTRIMTFAEKIDSLLGQNERLKKENKALKNTTAMKEIERLTKLLSANNKISLEERLKKSNDKIKAEKYDELIKVIDNNPKLKQEIDKAVQQDRGIQEILQQIKNKNRGR